ncbi:MAG: hypothetical protein WDZ91_03415 [Paenibacillaceae bacterium]
MKKSLFMILSLFAMITFSVQPVFAESVVSSYSDWLTKANCPYPPCNTTEYSSPQFDMVRSYVTVKGYQYLPGFPDDVTLTYQVVDEDWFFDDVYGETIKTGYYKDSLFTITISTFTAKPGVKVKVINPSTQIGPKVEGSVYQ